MGALTRACQAIACMGNVRADTFMAENGGAGVSKIRVYQLSRNDSVAEERLA